MLYLSGRCSPLVRMLWIRSRYWYSGWVGFSRWVAEVDIALGELGMVKAKKEDRLRIGGVLGQFVKEPGRGPCE